VKREGEKEKDSKYIQKIIREDFDVLPLSPLATIDMQQQLLHVYIELTASGAATKGRTSLSYIIRVFLLLSSL